MARGKPCTVEDERQLRQFLTEKKSRRSIAKILGKSLTSVQMKTSRLGLVVVDGVFFSLPSTTTFDKLILPIELPSIEQELKILVAALKYLETPNLDKTDVLRLRGIDLGFSEKATKYFIVAYVECETPVRLRTELRRLLKRLHQKERYSKSRNELKFSRMDEYCRKSALTKNNRV